MINIDEVIKVQGSNGWLILDGNMYDKAIR